MTAQGPRKTGGAIVHDAVVMLFVGRAVLENARSGRHDIPYLHGQRGLVGPGNELTGFGIGGALGVVGLQRVGQFLRQGLQQFGLGFGQIVRFANILANVIQTAFLCFPEIQHVVVTLHDGGIGTVALTLVLTLAPQVGKVPDVDARTLNGGITQDVGKALAVDVLHGLIGLHAGKVNNGGEEVLNHDAALIFATALYLGV